MGVRREILQNDTSTTLASLANAGDGTLSLTSGASFPSTGDYRILVDQEIMLVTARSGNTLTVSRGHENTTAALHNAGATVQLILTYGSFQRYLRDNVMDGDTSRPPLHRMANKASAILTSSDFAWVNQGSWSVADQDGGLYFTGPGNTTNLRIFKKAAPATPYSVIAAIHTLHFGDDDIEPGLVFRESVTGKLIHLTWWTDNANQKAAVFRYTNASTFASTAVNIDSEIYHPAWLKIEDDGTNLKFYISHNGINWLQLHSEARGSFFTTAPDEIGFAIIAKNTSFNALSNLLLWTEE